MKTRRQRVGPYDYKLAYLAGVIAGRDETPSKPSKCPYYGKEAVEWNKGRKAALEYKAKH